jgi:hypothetical protein
VWALPIKGPIKGTIVGLSPIQSLLTGCRGHTQQSELACGNTRSGATHTHTKSENGWELLAQI